MPKRTRRATKRIPATHNFVYEFDPFASSSSVSNNDAVTRGRDVSNTNAADASIKCAGGDKHHGPSNARIHDRAALPKSNPFNDVVTGKRDSEIDREVEKVKCEWRTLRADNRWTEGKNYANARTRKLYDTLERMTREIDKLQTSYLNPKSNQFLHRGAVKTLDHPRITFEEKAEKVKDMLFPKDPGQAITDETFKNDFGDPREHSAKHVRSTGTTFDKKSHAFDAKRRVKSTNSTLEDANTVHRRSKKKMDEYLEKYMNEVEKNLTNSEKSKELNVSTEDVTSMLKRFNMNSFDVYENSPLPSAERMSSGRKRNCLPRGAIDRRIGTATVKENCERRNMRNSDTSIQTVVNANCEGNTFIEMGLRTLGNNISRGAMSRVRQSEFLKKDASLKPM